VKLIGDDLQHVMQQLADNENLHLSICLQDRNFDRRRFWAILLDCCTDSK